MTVEQPGNDVGPRRHAVPHHGVARRPQSPGQRAVAEQPVEAFGDRRGLGRRHQARLPIGHELERPAGVRGGHHGSPGGEALQRHVPVVLVERPVVHGQRAEVQLVQPLVGHADLERDP